MIDENNNLGFSQKLLSREPFKSSRDSFIFNVALCSPLQSILVPGLCQVEVTARWLWRRRKLDGLFNYLHSRNISTYLLLLTGSLVFRWQQLWINTKVLSGCPLYSSSPPDYLTNQPSEPPPGMRIDWIVVIRIFICYDEMFFSQIKNGHTCITSPPLDRQVVTNLCPHQKVTIVHRVFYWTSIKQISLCRAAKVTFVRHPWKCPQTKTETVLLLNNNKIDWIITVVSVTHDIKKKPSSPPSTKEEDMKCH